MCKYTFQLENTETSGASDAFIFTSNTRVPSSHVPPKKKNKKTSIIKIFFSNVDATRHAMKEKM